MGSRRAKRKRQEREELRGLGGAGLGGGGAVASGGLTTQGDSSGCASQGKSREGTGLPYLRAPASPESPPLHSSLSTCPSSTYPANLNQGAAIGDVFLGSAVINHDRRIPLPAFDKYGLGHAALLATPHLQVGLAGGRWGLTLNQSRKEQSRGKEHCSCISESLYITVGSRAGLGRRWGAGGRWGREEEGQEEEGMQGAGRRGDREAGAQGSRHGAGRRQPRRHTGSLTMCVGWCRRRHTARSATLLIWR